MRIRATVAAVSGALALSALAVPAAQATTSTPTLNVTFSNVKVDDGKTNFVVGTTGKVAVPVTYTLNHPASVRVTHVVSGVEFYRGTPIPDVATVFFIGDGPGTCTTVSSTALKCSETITLAASELRDSDAGTLTVGGGAIDEKTGVTKIQGDLGKVTLKRAARLTANATPEPVKEGRTITVSGQLTHADWNGAGTYCGYADQAVKLQFRKKGSTTYTTLNTIRTTSTGALKTTVTASVDGSFRYRFAGTGTTSSVTSAADFVDVQ
ncbi:hypothetical protein [Streptomyces sp. NPDC058964]|uniref:hypothetical protein n=1 Tax=Streptomyces sp. NPDC058964 TaxID=3346681 RepID=UPI003685FDBA